MILIKLFLLMVAALTSNGCLATPSKKFQKASAITIIKLNSMGEIGYFNISNQGFKGNSVTIVKIGEARSDGFKWQLAENECDARFKLRSDKSKKVDHKGGKEGMVVGEPNIHRWIFTTPNSKTLNGVEICKVVFN